MATVKLGDWNFKEQEPTEESNLEKDFIEGFNEDIEVDEGYEEWEKNILNSENPSEELYKHLKTIVSPTDIECLESILEHFQKGEKLDIVSLESKLKQKFPEINPIAIFQYVMLLSGIGKIKLE